MPKNQNVALNSPISKHANTRLIIPAVGIPRPRIDASTHQIACKVSAFLVQPNCRPRGFELDRATKLNGWLMLTEQ